MLSPIIFNFYQSDLPKLLNSTVRIPCLWNLHSGFKSFAGSLIIQDGLQIPMPRTPDFPRFWIPQAKISPIPESGLPDVEQSTGY